VSEAVSRRICLAVDVTADLEWEEKKRVRSSFRGRSEGCTHSPVKITKANDKTHRERSLVGILRVIGSPVGSESVGGTSAFIPE
jgi:hypothetical protein